MFISKSFLEDQKQHKWKKEKYEIHSIKDRDNTKLCDKRTQRKELKKI